MSRLTTLVFALSFVVLVLAQNNCELHENEPVVLGDAEHFSVLAGAAITNSGASEVIGDVGVSPGTAVTGFGPDVMKHHSSIELASSDGASGKIDLAVAYNDAASRDACPIAKIGELGGMTLTPGLYKSTSGMAVSTDLILDAKGYEEAVWIFQMASTFVSAVSAKIVLQNGANARNIFWQVGSSGTIGAYSTFEGTMMAHASITLGAGAVVNGRIFAQTGAVTMLANIITLPHPHACHDHHHHHSCDQRPVALGEAEHFSVLAGAQVTNIGTSAIFGDLGVSPGTAVTGVGPDVMLQDSSIAAQLVSDAGKIDLAIAYNDAASRDACPIAKIGELGGMTLTPGLYKSTSGMAVSTDLILDAKGYEEAVWIFQMASTFVSAVSAKIVLQNGANARNIFWQVGSSGTIGAYSTFEGTMMAHASITLGAGAVVNGRVLARTAAVTMISNNITRPMPQGNDSMDWHVPSHSSHAVWN